MLSCEMCCCVFVGCFSLIGVVLVVYRWSLFVVVGCCVVSVGVWCRLLFGVDCWLVFVARWLWVVVGSCLLLLSGVYKLFSLIVVWWCVLWFVVCYVRVLLCVACCSLSLPVVYWCLLVLLFVVVGLRCCCLLLVVCCVRHVAAGCCSCRVLMFVDGVVC